MFIRAKKVKGKEYAYLVKNEWTANGSRQKVAKYLGSLHRHEKKYEKSNAQELFQESFQNSLLAFARNELLNHGFCCSNCGNLFEKDSKNGNLKIDLQNKTVFCGGKPAAIKLNDGNLCSHTLAELFAVKKSGQIESAGQNIPQSGQSGAALANALESAGIKVSAEQFIKLFEQLQSE